jgi:hypothetical protein
LTSWPCTRQSWKPPREASRKLAEEMQERHEKEGERQRQLTHPKDKEATAEEKVRLLYEEGYWVTLEQWALGISRAKLCSLAMMGYIQ